MSLQEIKTRHLLECKIDFRHMTDQNIDDLVDQLMTDRGELLDKLAAVKSIRREYANLIAQERGLVGADTVLDMIDAALAIGE